MQNLISGSSGTGRYTTVHLTRTRYTTIIWSGSQSPRSVEPATHSSSPPSSSSSSSSSSCRISSSTACSGVTPVSSVQSFTYEPTTLSTATIITSRSTTTVKTIVHMTSTLTVVETPSTSTSYSATSTEDAKSTTAQSAAASSSTSSDADAAAAGNGKSSSQMISPDGSSKHSAAIAGGMTGSIAGIAMLGLLFLFLLRRRKRHPRQDDEKSQVAHEPRMSSSSQALPSAIAAAGATHANDSAAMLGIRQSRNDQLPIIEHNLIHMDLDHWHRPFAHEDPRLRDDTSPLRLMNPDPTPTPPVTYNNSSTSLPPTATTTSPHGFLQRQRSALAAALLSVKRSFSGQDAEQRHPSDNSSTLLHPPNPPKHQETKLTMPSELILAGGAPPRPISSHSRASTHTIIRHYAPSDPFTASPIPNCLQPGTGPHRRDFLAPPPLRLRPPPLVTSIQTPIYSQQHREISPLTRSNSDVSGTSFEGASPTRSEVSSVSVRSGPFDLATASVVGGDAGGGEERPVVADRGLGDGGGGDEQRRGQREQTPNWVVHVYPGT